MPPVSRKSPSPVPRRRPAVAGSRTPGADRGTRIPAQTVDETAQPMDGLAQPSGKVESPTASLARPHRNKRKSLALAVRRRPGPLSTALALAAVLLIAAAVLATVSWVHADGAKDSAGTTANVALVDAPDTQQVAAAAVDILQKAYSYSYTSIDANLDAAVAMMTPDMAAQHRANFNTIRKTVTDAKTTTKATVVSDGVKLLEGDRAEVIAFVAVTGDNGGTALKPSGYRFTANMLRTNGKWQLSGLTES